LPRAKGAVKGRMVSRGGAASIVAVVGGEQMRFMVMHKVDAKMEAGEKPAQGIVERMGKYVGESIEKGVFKDGAGLHGSAQRVRMVFEGGKRVSVQKGPYEGRNELLAGFAMIQAWSIDEAVEKATKIGAACGNAELEVGLVVEPWDIGIVAKPEDEMPKRYLVFRKADRAFEGGNDEVRLDGVYQQLGDEEPGSVISVGTLAPSKRGARLTKAERRWMDGPFAESKEMVAGYSIIEVAGLEEAKRWAEAYGDILVDNEVDVREVVG